MSLSFRGPAGSVEFRWIAYALLRDNVVHHLGGTAATFASLHAVTRALAGHRVQLDALELRAEAERARDELLARPIGEIAISRRTRSLLEYDAPAPGAAAETFLVSESGLDLSAIVAGATSLDDAFGFLVRGLLKITEDARPGDVVEVADL